MYLFRVKELIRYHLQSGYRKGHGIHSPFIFDLVSRVFRNKTDQSVVKQIEYLRKSMLSDKREISVKDFGAGSVVRKQNEGLRSVADIAKYSSIPQKYGELLYNLAHEFGHGGILELGTSLGISTLYMALAMPQEKIYTVEGDENIAGIAGGNFKSLGTANIVQYCGTFSEKLPEIFKTGVNAGLVFIDGDHRKEPLLKYFDIIAGNSSDKTVVVVDDIYLSPQMKEAWSEMRANSKVSVSIDIHRFGILFFRKGINRNHYFIRY